MRAGRLALCAAIVCVAWLAPLATDVAAAADAGSRLDARERALIREINRVRSRHGLPRVRFSRALARSADAHTRDMLRANFFGHASSNGTSMERRVGRFRPSHRLGENLAYLPRGRPGAAAIVRMWLRSPTHRAILLSPAFRRVGVGRRTGSFGGSSAVVYTADFASAR